MTKQPIRKINDEPQLEPEELRTELERALNHLDMAWGHLVKYNRSVTLDGRLDSEIDQCERSVTNDMRTVAKKVRAQRITGRSEIPAAYFDDDAADMDD